MLTATKGMLLAGETYRAGESIPAAHWASLTPRIRKVLERNKLVRSSDLQPVAATNSPPVALTTPRTADGSRKRGCPRKES